MAVYLLLRRLNQRRDWTNFSSIYRKIDRYGSKSDTGTSAGIFSNGLDISESLILSNTYTVFQVKIYVINTMKVNQLSTVEKCVVSFAKN